MPATNNVLIKVTNTSWNQPVGYDRYDEFVIVCNTDNLQEAVDIIITNWGGFEYKTKTRTYPEGWENTDTWELNVIGNTDAAPGPVLASFNAA